MFTMCPRATVVLATVLAMASLSAQRDDTHGRDAVPDYERVFNQDEIGRIEIRMAAADWDAVVADMDSMSGRFGAAGGFGMPQPGAGGGGQFPAANTEAVAACTGRTEGDACSFGTPAVSGRCIQTGNASPLTCANLPGGGGPPGGNPGGGFPGGGNPGSGNAGGGAGGNNAPRDDVELLPRTPIYVPVDLTFDGETFRHVGFRLKGNSSLVNTWQRGTEKVPFRLNIDALEDRYPEVANQTFFGFPNLGFSNNILDSSYLRAKVVTDLMREAGLPAPKTAFMRVYFDRGAGLTYLGLFTMIEIPDEPMLDTLFGSSAGNLYKPHGTGGRWTVFVADDFPKRTNDADQDWTDIEDAIAALNDATGDREVWRRRLEARVDVGTFLRWLALNTLVGNNDAYGGLSAHNYYLYGSPRHRDRLFWIPWDHDLSIPSTTGGLGGGGGGFGGGVGQVTTLDLFHTRIGGEWPLIRRLLDDPVYRSVYRGHLEELLNSVLEPARVSARVRAEYDRIVPYVIGPSGEAVERSFAGTAAQFEAAAVGPAGIAALLQSRATAARAAVSSTR
jgi:spore coat protein H